MAKEPSVDWEIKRNNPPSPSDLSPFSSFFTYMATIRQLYDAIETDELRAELGFSPEVLAAQTDLLKATSDAERATVLRGWLAKYQPCVFGKISATNDMIEFCFLTESDLLKPDQDIKAKIHKAHRRWWRAADRGQKSGFVLLAVSESLALARPDANMLQLAQRLAKLYLIEEEVSVDRVYLDQVFLKIRGDRHNHRFRWDAGVNVFAAAGDRRWWQDHRIPGGLAFSVNSVGHMAKAGQLRGSLLSLGIEDDELTASAVGNLDDAHRYAMLTIANAYKAVSGPATWLLRAEEVDPQGCPPATAKLGKRLEGFSPCEYAGLYHTDHTLPSAYFRGDVEAPADIAAMTLDFTYLYVNSIDNAAYHTMGAGEQISGDQLLVVRLADRDKGHRVQPTKVRAADLPDFSDKPRPTRHRNTPRRGH